MRILFIILSFIAFTNVQAQTGTITGKVLNTEDSKPLTGATVSLFGKADSALVKAEITSIDGSFVVETPKSGDFFLEISSVGFDSKTVSDLPITAGKKIDLGQISLKPSAQTLSGVVVTAQKPLVQYKADKLVFNVASSVGADSKNALEMLEKAPGITVDKDGNISMRGKSGVKVMIDDRLTYLNASDLANYLKSLPATSLDQLEIMTNPSAKYDASGNSGIINIRTKKLQKAGLNGNIGSSLSMTDKVSGRGNANVNYRNGKVNLFGTYSYSNSNNKWDQPILRYFKNEQTGNVQSIFEQQTTSDNKEQSNNIKMGADLYMNDKTIVGLVLSGYNNNRNTLLTGNSVIKNGAGAVDSMLEANNRFWGSMRNRSLNANLRHTFDSTGKKMTADFDYIKYNMPQTSTVVTNFFGPDAKPSNPSTLLTGNMPSSLKIYSGKVDFTLPMKIGQIETGLKASSVATDNLTEYNNIMDGKSELDLGKSNHFLYKENIFAAYVSWSQQFGKLGVQAGLRAEDTHTNGHQLGNALNPDSSFTRDYLNLFPTAYLSYNANDKNTFGLSFGRRIQRPNYSSLNPFIYFIDEYTYEVGNVYLKPQFTNQVEISHDFKGLIHSAVNYSHTSGAISDVLLQDQEKGIIYSTLDNIASINQLSFSTGTNFRTAGKLMTNIDMSVNYSKFEGQLPTEYLDKSDWSYTVKISEQATLGKGWNAELSGLYLSPQVYGQMEINKFWKADFSVQKKVLEDKGVVSFSVGDIFNTWQFKSSTSNSVVDILIGNKQRMSRTFSLGFRYNFGNPIKGLKQYRSGSADTEQSRIGK